MTATLYIVGTGPGDPELLTLKAVKSIKRCPVIISPRGSANGGSTALSILKPVISLAGKEVYELHFPMKKIKSGQEPDPEVLVAWRYAAETVLSSLDSGKDVCFPTLGDPAIYSTGYYLYETICGLRNDVNVVFIPGVPAMSSCSASMAQPICLGDEMVAVIPATFSDTRLKEVLELFDTIVLMKVHRVIDRLTTLLEECGLLENAVLVEHAGTSRERVIENFSSLIDHPHYFSTIIVRKAPVTARVLIN
jgi:precorrin-2/cobalt-factor-2 C20-methyltransferase